MKVGDKVWISLQDIEACGYGDSINCEGEISGFDGRKWIVSYKSENYPYEIKEGYFNECDLKFLDSHN